VSRSLLYFAYGSNLHPLRLRERVPSSRCLALAELAGYQLRFHKSGRDGSGKCNAHGARGGGERVLGAIYELAGRDKPRLDKAENLGAGYNETQLYVWGGGSSRGAFTYIADPCYVDDLLPPYEWYRQLVFWGARYHRFSQNYVRAIVDQRALKDPIQARSDRYRNLLRAMEKMPCAALEPRLTKLYCAVMR
jgi:gamma-glutamylcyclotransferase